MARDKYGASRWAGSGRGYLHLSHELLHSEAYRGLSANGKALLIACMMEAWSVTFQPEHERPFIEKPDGEKERGAFWFTMNRGKWSDKYGIFPKASQHQAYNTINELIEAGFICRVMSGAVGRTSSIYRMSGRWKDNKNDHRDGNSIMCAGEAQGQS